MFPSEVQRDQKTRKREEEPERDRPEQGKTRLRIPKTGRRIHHPIPCVEKHEAVQQEEEGCAYMAMAIRPK